MSITLRAVSTVITVDTMVMAARVPNGADDGKESDRARAPRRAPPGVVELHLSDRVKIRIEGNVLRSMPIHEISQLHVSIRFH